MSDNKQQHTVEGRVISNKMTKSVVVTIERQVRDDVYGKQLRRTSRFMAHDESNSAKTGDRVLIQETRPMSKRKRWILREVIVKAKA